MLLYPRRESLSETIITDLSNYRHKRIMGLAGMFGDHLLSSRPHDCTHLYTVVSLCYFQTLFQIRELGMRLGCM